MNPVEGILRAGCFYGKGFFICRTTGKTVKGITQERGVWEVKLETVEGPPEYHTLICPWDQTHALEVNICGSQETLACKGCGGIWLAIVEEDGRLKYLPKAAASDYTEMGEIPILENEQINFVKDTHVDMTTEMQSQPTLVESRESSLEKIKAQISRGYQLRHHEVRSEDELKKVVAECRKWSNYNKTLLSKLFTNSSVADGYSGFNYQRPIGSKMNPLVNPSLEEQVGRYWERMITSINSLEGICEQLELYDEPSDNHSPTLGNKVFIVHGHDEAAKHEIARFIAGLDLRAIILDEQPSRGQTIIDKFEEHADESGFAIVLLTADDVGAPRDRIDKLKPRARQNVVMELGYFLRGLGRERVCVLYETGVELPSDIRSLLYVTMDNAGGWKLKVAKEMKIAGLPINPDNLL